MCVRFVVLLGSLSTETLTLFRQMVEFMSWTEMVKIWCLEPNIHILRVACSFSSNWWNYKRQHSNFRSFGVASQSWGCSFPSQSSCLCAEAILVFSYLLSCPIWGSVLWWCCIKNSSSCKEQTVRNGDKQEEVAGQFPAAGGGLAGLSAVYFELGMAWVFPGVASSSTEHTAKPRSMWSLAFLMQVAWLCSHNSTSTSIKTGRSKQATSCRNF